DTGLNWAKSNLRSRIIRVCAKWRSWGMSFRTTSGSLPISESVRLQPRATERMGLPCLRRGRVLWETTSDNTLREGFRNTCCPQHSWCWRACRLLPTASLITRACLNLKRLRPGAQPNTFRHRHRRRRYWFQSGWNCFQPKKSAPRTTFLIWADILCWPPRLWQGSENPLVWTCHCGAFSNLPPSQSLPPCWRRCVSRRSKTSRKKRRRGLSSRTASTDNSDRSMNIQLNDRKSRLSASKQLLLEKRLRGESLPPQEAHRIPRRNRQEEAPLSYAQQRLWFLQQLEPKSPAYNIHFGLKIQGRLDVDALRFSFADIVRRHEVLRTTFPARRGKPVPVVANEPVVTLEELDLRGLNEDLLRAEAGRQVSNESRTPFDLARGPLLRVKLLRMGDEEFALLVPLHHIVGDGWAMSVLVRELPSLYRAHIEGKQPPLPPLEIQYADFAAWQQQWLRGEVLEKQLSYWRKQLAGNVPLVLP